jgi:hypothetical protein
MDRRRLLAMAAGSLVLKGQAKEYEAASIKPSAPGGRRAARAGRGDGAVDFYSVAGTTRVETGIDERAG